MALQMVRTNGELLEKRILQAIDAAFWSVGLDPAKYRVVTQGSYDHGSLSAGTHSGNGVFDLRVWNIPTAKWIPLVVALRRRGFCAWLRTARYGWTKGDHIHAVDRFATDLASGARQQVEDYKDGLNGLANRARDPHPRPAMHKWPWPIVEQANLGEGKVNGDVLLLQKALHLYVGLDYSGGVTAGGTRGTYGRRTAKAMEAAAVKSGKRGLALLKFLGNLYGFRAA